MWHGYVGYGNLQLQTVFDNSSNNHGRLMFRRYDGRWGYVCNTGFDDDAGQVACRQLGYSYRYYYTDYYG